MQGEKSGGEDAAPNMSAMRGLGTRLVAILGLAGSPVGVRLLAPGADPPTGAAALKHHRYCQAIMKARRGATLPGRGRALLPGRCCGLRLPAAPSATRLRERAVGFGHRADPAVGRRIFEAMPKLAPGRVGLLHLFPLDRAEHVPDIVVLEDETEKLMWVVLAYLNATGGERVQGTTAVLQAVCADSTIVPLTEQRLNFGYGCYGCREASDIGPNETVIGFPASLAGTDRHAS